MCGLVEAFSRTAAGISLDAIGAGGKRMHSRGPNDGAMMVAAGVQDLKSSRKCS